MGKCPKSFHLFCLKMKESDIPEDKWFCPCCIPRPDRKKNANESITEEEKRKLKNEKRRLYRLRKKEEMLKKGGKSSISVGKNIKKKSKKSKKKSSPPSKRSLEISPTKSSLNGKMTINSLPMVPLISDDIQSKLLHQQKRMHESL